MTLRERLKSETMQDHHAVEGVFPVFGKDFSEQKYTELLQRLYGFYKPLEAKMSEVSGLDFDRSERLRLPRLEKDLAGLGVHADKVAGLPNSSMLPEISNLSNLAGVMYVIEGSTLGGQLITKHLKEKFGENAPIHYFNCYGDKTGQYWKEFVAWLNTLEMKDINADDAIRSARETFRCLNQWVGAKTTNPL